jgi:hypothetical protein
VVAVPPTPYHNAMRKRFKTPSWFSDCNAWITEASEFFQHIGADNFSNATRKFDALQEEIREKTEIIQEFIDLTQTTHRGNAKMRIISLMRGATFEDLSKLPEAFHRPPAIWLSGKKKTVVSEGFAPMGVRDAERKHRVILPLLIEVWELAADDEEERLQIEKAYRNWSADDLEKELYQTINKLEEPTLEDLLEEATRRKEEEHKAWCEENEEARLRANRKKNR